MVFILNNSIDLTQYSISLYIVFKFFSFIAGAPISKYANFKKYLKSRKET